MRKLGSLSWPGSAVVSRAGLKPEDWRYKLVRLEGLLMPGKAPLQMHTYHDMSETAASALSIVGCSDGQR